MRLTLLKVFVSGISLAVCCLPQSTVHNGGEDKPQNSAPKFTEESFRLAMLEHLLGSGAPLRAREPQLFRMGDEAAVGLMKIIGKRGVSMNDSKYLPP
jgi:hypothetical protein